MSCLVFIGVCCCCLSLYVVGVFSVLCYTLSYVVVFSLMLNHLELTPLTLKIISSHLSLFSSLSLFHVFLSCPVSPCWHSRNITNLGSPEPYNRDFRLDTGERAHLQSISWEIEAEELKTSSGNQCRLHSVTPLKQHKRNTQRRLLKHKI